MSHCCRSANHKSSKEIVEDQGKGERAVIPNQHWLFVARVRSGLDTKATEEYVCVKATGCHGDLVTFPIANVALEQ